jgi:crossover junction endodeoxyribonuclease RusA
VTTLRFELPHAMTLSANGRQHWAQKARATRNLRTLAAHSADQQMVGRGIRYDRAHLTVHVGWPTRHRRDVANISPTIKALIDGIVDAGLLPDDDDTHLIGPDLRPYFAGVKGHVVLDFEFEEVA